MVSAFTTLFQHQGDLIRLRALRVFKELPRDLIGNVNACDLSEFSRTIFHKNLDLNELDRACINYELADTNQVLMKSNFDVIDLDPYGSMIPFIYSSIHSLGARGKPGLLCVTCTDTKVLMGPERLKCYYDYGTSRGGSDCPQETALRIAIYALSRVASIQQKSIRVLLSIHSEFYIRMYVEVNYGKKECQKTISQHGNLMICQGCGAQWAHTFGRFDQDRTIYNKIENCSPCKFCGGPVALSCLTRRTFMDRFNL